jgi:hypothetical protein
MMISSGELMSGLINCRSRSDSLNASRQTATSAAVVTAKDIVVYDQPVYRDGPI